MNAVMNATRLWPAKALCQLIGLVLVVMLGACGGTDDMSETQTSSDSSSTMSSVTGMPVSPDTSIARHD
jgi:hypothetical protein